MARAHGTAVVAEVRQFDLGPQTGHGKILLRGDMGYRTNGYLWMGTYGWVTFARDTSETLSYLFSLSLQ